MMIPTWKLRSNKGSLEAPSHLQIFELILRRIIFMAALLVKLTVDVCISPLCIQSQDIWFIYDVPLDVSAVLLIDLTSSLAIRGFEPSYTNIHAARAPRHPTFLAP